MQRDRFHGNAMTTSDLLAHIEAWANEMETYQLLDAEQKSGLGDAITAAREGRATEDEGMLLILLLGATGGGKSELLNALAGDRIAESSHLRPTTRRPTIYAHRTVSADSFSQYGSAIRETTAQPGAIVRHERDSLRNKLIIDAPDIDSFETAHRDLVMRMIPAVDVALYVVTPQSYKNDVGWETVAKERGTRAFAFILNKWDGEAKPQAAGGAEIDVDFASLLRERGGYAEPLIFCTSAKFQVAQKTGAQKSEPPAGDQFRQLEQWLEAGLQQTDAQVIQRRRKRALWGRLGLACRAAAPATAGLDAWSNQVEEILTESTEAALQETEGDLLLTAHALSDTRADLRRPITPGLLGATFRVTGAVARIPEFLRRSSSRSDPADRLPINEASAMRAAEAMLRGSARAEFTGRELGLPMQWFAVNSTARTGEFAQQWQLRLDAVVTQIRNQNFGRARRYVGAGLLYAIEIGIWALLAVALWRLANSFVTGNYAGWTFAANFLILLFTLLILGHAIAGAVFSASPKKIHRDLRAASKAVVWEQSGELRVAAEEFASALKRLAGQNDEICKACDAKIGSLEDPAVGKKEIERLFASPSEAIVPA